MTASVRALKLEAAPLSTVAGIFFPILQHPLCEIFKRIPGTADWQQYETNKKGLAKAQELLQRRKQEIELNSASCRDDVVSLMLKARQQSKEMQHQLDDKRTTLMAYELFLAGTNTTATSIANVLYCVSAHPEVERKLLKEIDKLAPLGSKLTVQDVDKLTYLDQVIKESMRMRIVIPILLRETSESMELGEYHMIHIPKVPVMDLFPFFRLALPPVQGTWVWMALNAVQEDAANFAEPHLFRPKRFDPNCEEAKTRHPFAHLPFGLGPRMCLGYRFARLEMKLALIHLYQRLTFQHSPLMEKPLALTFGLTVAPKYGIKLHIHKRM